MVDNSSGAVVPQEIIIRNESDAWQALAQLTKEDSLEEQTYAIKIEAWDGLDIHLKGAKFHTSITPKVVEPFDEFQKGIYLAYAILQYGVADTRRLTRDEKRDLQLMVHVKEGSTGLTPDFKECFNRFAEKLGENMEPKHAIIIAVILGLMYFGTDAWSDYLQHRVDIRKEEARSKTTRDMLDHLEYAGELENKRTALIADLAQGNEGIRQLYEQSDVAHYSLLKGLRNADRADFDGKEITAPIANELSKTSRQGAKETRLDGNYRITRVNSDSSIGFILRVVDVDSGLAVTASLDNDFPLSEDELSVLQNAEWGKTPAKLTINARIVGRRIVSAKIIKVEKYEENDDIKRSDSEG